MRINIKWVGFLLVLFLMVIFFIQWLIHYLTIGRLVITTNDPSDNITIVLSGNIASSSKSPSMSGKGSFSSRLKSGGYLINVAGSSNGKAQYVTVRAHETTRVNITLPGTVGVEPVVFDNAQDVIADKSRLVYLDNSDHSLGQINNQNQHSEIDLSSYGFKSIEWSDTTHGVGQNTSGKLFVLNNGSIYPLSSPASNKDDSSVIYAVAPNRNIYIGIGSFVYAGSETGKFKEIYSGLTPGSSLIPGLNIVGIINSGYGSGPNSSTSNLTVIDSSGHKSNIKFNSFVNAWSAWSTNDKYVAILGSTSGEILDSSLHKIATIPEATLANAVWLNDGTLFYSVADQLWSYNLESQSSQLIANMPLGDPIQQLSISSDKSYVYITTFDTANGVAIRRVGLQGQKVPDYIYQLQDILPESTPGAGYSLGLYNFSGGPTIQVIRSAGGPTSPQLAAEQELQSDGFDITKLQFQVEQGD